VAGLDILPRLLPIEKGTSYSSIVASYTDQITKLAAGIVEVRSEVKQQALEFSICFIESTK